MCLHICLHKVSPQEELEEALLGREPAGGTGLYPPASAPGGRGSRPPPLPQELRTALHGQPAGGSSGSG